MKSASKTTFSQYNLNILRPEVTKNIKNLYKKFCEFRPIAISSFLKYNLLQKISRDTLVDLLHPPGLIWCDVLFELSMIQKTIFIL